MTCEHTPVIKDGASQNETYKVAVCTKCHEIIKIQPRNEKPKEESVWDIKDKRIGRMSVLKSAVDLSVAAKDVSWANVKELAEVMEEWVRRV